MENDFGAMADYYDDLYMKAEKYQKEAVAITSIIEKYILSDGHELLDIACGTGGHIPYWLNTYKVSGIDISPEMLKAANRKYPGIEFHRGDMVDFTLDKYFDVLVCLWGSIGFVRTIERLNRAMITFAGHLKPGGILCLAPWSTQEEFKPVIVVDSVKTPDVRIARMENVMLKSPGLIEIDFHHLIGRNGKIRYHRQSIEIGLFSQQQYRDAITGAGLELVEHYHGPEVRFGAFIAHKPPAPN